MKYAYTLPAKKDALDRHCKANKCRNCCLVTTAYCMLGNKTAGAINAAYDVLVKNSNQKRGGKNA